MIEIIKTIAILCQISAGGSAVVPIERAQVSCHKYYISCFNKESGSDGERLRKCILKRNPRQEVRR